MESKRLFVPIILCGGSGTRLWPISTPEIPKQFISLGVKGTFLQETIRRVERIGSHLQTWEVVDPILIMHHTHILPTELQSHSPNIVLEPYANDTAVAVARATQEVKARYVDRDPVLLVVPADHYIEATDIFVEDLVNGILNVTSENIVLFGIRATAPETKYGYILSTETGVIFKEKPNREIALALMEQAAMWNSGIFAAATSTVESCLNRSPAKILDWIANPREGKAPSFDVAVLQEYDKITARSCDGWGWSDVGSFQSFTQIPEVEAEIASDPNITIANCHQIKVLNRNQSQIVVVGCSNLLIVTHNNQILIMDTQTDHDNSLKDIATKLAGN